MISRTDQLLAALRADWPGWFIWYVPRAVGGTVWGAHPVGDDRHVINADSADELADLIKQEG